MNRFVIHTQVLENYGAHCESGKFSDGQHYWKFKGGDSYIVEGLDRMQDAVAFVAAAFCDNGIGWKEFPCHYETLEEWHAGCLLYTSPSPRDRTRSRMPSSA